MHVVCLCRARKNHLYGSLRDQFPEKLPRRCLLAPVSLLLSNSLILPSHISDAFAANCLPDTIYLRREKLTSRVVRALSSQLSCGEWHWVQLESNGKIPQNSHFFSKVLTCFSRFFWTPGISWKCAFIHTFTYTCTYPKMVKVPFNHWRSLAFCLPTVCSKLLFPLAYPIHWRMRACYEWIRGLLLIPWVTL